MFNYTDWLPEENPEKKPSQSAASASSDSEMVERAIRAVEEAAKDITGDYATWRDLGFALSAEFGEGGREYYHRISRFHPDYNPKDCDAQYTRCLKSAGQGIGIGTFFHFVKEAGVQVGSQKLGAGSQKSGAGVGSGDGQRRGGTSGGGMFPSDGEQEVLEEEAEEEEPMPVFPERVYAGLPDFLRRAVEPGTSAEERDILLLGSLVGLGSVLNSFFGIYDGKLVLPNLYLFITAPASAGKGRLGLCRKLLMPLHRELREQSKGMRQQYDSELAEYNAAKGEKGEKPVKPPERMLFLPANSSSTGIFQLLHDNQGRGIIFETEGDTIAQAMKTEYGNYSDGLRKAFHHEPISYYRRTDREYVDIDAPCLSAVLSGTPRQVASLVPNAENGLFSRFLFYYMNLKPEWKDVFAPQANNGIDEYYVAMGYEFSRFHKTLDPQAPVKVHFSRKQRGKFHSYFERIQNKYLGLKDEEYVASVRRMGLISFRLAMILTALRRMETGSTAKEVTCEDRDFNTAMLMVSVLLRHSSKVYSRLPLEKRLPDRGTRNERFLEALPTVFCRQQYLEVAARLNIPSKTAERFLARFVKTGAIERVKFDHYQKPETEWE